MWWFVFVNRGKLRKAIYITGVGTKVGGASAWSSITRSGIPHPAQMNGEVFVPPHSAYLCRVVLHDKAL